MTMEQPWTQEVWSKLPEEMIWEIMRLVPAAAHFRLQSVSRKWRQVLTSAGFRNTLTAGAGASRQAEAQQQPPVVAGVVTVPRPDHDTSSSKLKVVEIELTSFVPSWFWKTDSYTVEAAADGLVCISNDSKYWAGVYWAGVCDPGETRFCVLNPLTRTCKVLPKLPGPFEAQEFEPRVWLQPKLAPSSSCVRTMTGETVVIGAPGIVVHLPCGPASGYLGPCFCSYRRFFSLEAAHMSSNLCKFLM